MAGDHPSPDASFSLLDVGLYLTMHGYNWFWVGFACMIFSLLATVLLDLLRPRGIRLFHQIAIVVLTTASLAYFSMAFDLSTSSPEPELAAGEATRTVSYAWYIQWIINLPLLLLSVLLVTGLSLFEILSTLFAAVLLVLCGIIREHSSESYGSWFTVLGIAAFGHILFTLLVQGSKSAYAAGPVFGTRYLLSASLLAAALLGYPVAFALSQSPAARVALDVLAQPAFLALFLHQVHQIDSGAVCGTIALDGDEDDEEAASFVENTSRRLRRHHRGRF